MVTQIELVLLPTTPVALSDEGAKCTPHLPGGGPRGGGGAPRGPRGGGGFEGGPEGGGGRAPPALTGKPRPCVEVF